MDLLSANLRIVFDYYLEHQDKYASGNKLDAVKVIRKWYERADERKKQSAETVARLRLAATAEHNRTRAHLSEAAQNSTPHSQMMQGSRHSATMPIAAMQIPAGGDSTYEILAAHIPSWDIFRPEVRSGIVNKVNTFLRDGKLEELRAYLRRFQIGEKEIEAVLKKLSN
jgi:D-tyrosyl-tRNA(Tyr) deacylase